MIKVFFFINFTIATNILYGPYAIDDSYVHSELFVSYEYIDFIMESNVHNVYTAQFSNVFQTLNQLKFCQLNRNNFLYMFHIKEILYFSLNTNKIRYNLDKDSFCIYLHLKKLKNDFYAIRKVVHIALIYNLLEFAYVYNFFLIQNVNSNDLVVSDNFFARFTKFFMYYYNHIKFYSIVCKRFNLPLYLNETENLDYIKNDNSFSQFYFSSLKYVINHFFKAYHVMKNGKFVTNYIENSLLNSNYSLQKHLLAFNKLKTPFISHLNENYTKIEIDNNFIKLKNLRVPHFAINSIYYLFLAVIKILRENICSQEKFKISNIFIDVNNYFQFFDCLNCYSSLFLKSCDPKSFYDSLNNFLYRINLLVIKQTMLKSCFTAFNENFRNIKNKYNKSHTLENISVTILYDIFIDPKNELIKFFKYRNFMNTIFSSQILDLLCNLSSVYHKICVVQIYRLMTESNDTIFKFNNILHLDYTSTKTKLLNNNVSINTTIDGFKESEIDDLIQIYACNIICIKNNFIEFYYKMNRSSIDKSLDEFILGFDTFSNKKWQLDDYIDFLRKKYLYY